jgi:hypothetical protein
MDGLHVELDDVVEVERHSRTAIGNQRLQLRNMFSAQPAIEPQNDALSVDNPFDFEVHI